MFMVIKTRKEQVQQEVDSEKVVGSESLSLTDIEENCQNR